MSACNLGKLVKIELRDIWISESAIVVESGCHGTRASLTDYMEWSQSGGLQSTRSDAELLEQQRNVPDRQAS